MKKIPFVILTNLPIVGTAFRMMLDPFNSSMAKDDFHNRWTEEDRVKVINFKNEHPNDIVTFRILKEILDKNN